ncbi:MAG: galactokinase family protein [Balneolaceae bacterium]|nr:galactokinase family protein [Balneolaceae bacterium]
MKQLIEQIEQEFSRHFQEDHLIIKSPGRVNLIGEHTDYNDGFVLPAAIDKVIVLAMAPNNKNEINMVAVDKDETHHFSLDKPYSKTGKRWPDYILGVVVELEKAGYQVQGFDCVFGGNIPIGRASRRLLRWKEGLLPGWQKYLSWTFP